MPRKVFRHQERAAAVCGFDFKYLIFGCIISKIRYILPRFFEKINTFFKKILFFIMFFFVPELFIAIGIQFDDDGIFPEA